MATNPASDGAVTALDMLWNLDQVYLLFLQLIGWIVAWVVLFYFLVVTEPLWMRCRSSKDFENDKFWTARQLLGTLHSILVTAISVPVMWTLYYVDDKSRFAASTNLATCDAPGAFGEGRDLVGMAMGFAGMAFTSFIMADLVLSIVHGLATPDYIVHHTAFASAGLIIRGNCMVPYSASILLAMEISTPFLEFVLVFRHRNVFRKGVWLSSLLFLVLYIIFRIFLNTYGAVLLFNRRHTAFPESVPQWQVTFLLVAVCLGTLVQFVWFPLIVKFFAKDFNQPDPDKKPKRRTSSGLPTSSSSKKEE